MSKEIEKILVLPRTAHRYSLRPAFALNRALREVRIMAKNELDSLESPHIAPYLFNKRSRTFLSYGFTDDALTVEGEGETGKILGRIQDLISHQGSIKKYPVGQWRHYLRHVDTSDQKNKKEIEKCLKLDKDAEFRECLTKFSYDQWMDIYVHYKQHRNMHLNGILFKLLHEDEIGSIDALVFDINDLKGGRKDLDVEQEKKKDFFFVHRLSSSSEKWDEVGYREQQGIDDGHHGELIHAQLTEYFALKRDSKPAWVLLVPIYDYYITGQGYGGICATLQIPYKGEKLDVSEGGQASVAVRKLISCAPIISLEIAASGVELAIRDKVEDRHTAISEFVSGLRYLQDWECIEIKYSNPCEDSTFSRTKASESDCADSELKTGSGYVQCKESRRTSPVTLSWLREATKNQIAAAHNVNFEYIEGMEKNLSEFSWLQKAVFHFPKYFRLPEEKINGTENPYWQAYCDDLIRQQRELLSVLMPKLRARKAALRSAVSAIMGRNMSHNIGSHVLARYSNEVKNDNQGTDRKLKDRREDFLRYLQRRMDFIAEVATADQSFWFQALSIEGALGTLNLDKENEAINGKNGGGERKPILLSYITGKEVKADPLTATKADPLTATVEIAGETADHRYFACPSGEVGVHALYVILENIIRNSARHNESPACPITVRVKIEEEEHPDLWKITLIDLQTPISKSKCIDDEINEKLNTQILNSDGAPNPKYWGVREMQVCAQYLRNLPLSDLEGPEQIPPIFKAVNNEGCLAYVLYVPRAKLCVLVSKSPLVDDAQKKFLRAKGFDFVLSEGKTDAELADALRGYAYAVIEDDVQGIPQASTIVKLPNSNIVGENWVKKIDWPVRTLCMSKGRLEKLVSSLLDQTENIQGQGTVSDGAAFKPMKWLEDELHSRLMTEYKNRRGYLATSEVAVKVGWEDTCDEKNCKFEHTTTANLSKWTFHPGPFLCWIDHAKAEHFTSELPCLLAACRVTTNTPIDDAIKISAWVYAEVINSHSAHRHDLVSQRDGKISGNELMAAALAKVVIIDERVQSVACEQYREIGYSTLWPCMGIWVPSTQEANLNFPVFSEICTFLEKPAELSENLPIDFVVLHLTILEKLAQELRCDEQSALSQLISCAGLSPSCEVVIVTGRGVPAVARHEASKRLNARYLPISALLEYLVSNPSKLAVMRALWSAATSKTTE